MVTWRKLLQSTRREETSGLPGITAVPVTARAQLSALQPAAARVAKLAIVVVTKSFMVGEAERNPARMFGMSQKLVGD